MAQVLEKLFQCAFEIINPKNEKLGVMNPIFGGIQNPWFGWWGAAELIVG